MEILHACAYTLYTYDTYIHLMTTILYPGEAKPREYKNLLGLLRAGRKFGVQSVTIYGAPTHDAELEVTFNNGAKGQAHFASFTVCSKWVMSRRSWPGYQYHHNRR